MSAMSFHHKIPLRPFTKVRRQTRPSARYWTCRSSVGLARKYATHREPASSSILSGSLDTGSRTRTSQSHDTVGPFALGVSPSSMRDQRPVKKWAELSRAGKVGRTAERTTNLTVILLGAGLSAVLVYALTSELFSKNSPTALYGDACERIKASPKVTKYLNGPFVFHNNPPTVNRPRHRNRHVSSQIVVDSTGREHMLMNFYIEGRPPGSTSPTTEGVSSFDSLAEWVKEKTNGLSELTFDESVEWSKNHATRFWERSKRAFKYISGAPLPPAIEPLSVVDGRESKKVEENGAWSFAGLFSGLKGPKPTSVEVQATSDGRVWTDGEVHADLIRNDDGYFVFRYLLIDIPNSGVRNPVRVFVERGPGVRENETIMRWRSS